MRVLCLHGMGTNSGIFEAQTEMFRSLLPHHFEYEFFDADHEYPAAEGVGEIFPGPYYAFYPVPTTDNVAGAHQYVQEIIDEEGPFDAVMGFSQGAALAASILLRHEKEKPLEPAPFRLAIFICGSLPYWFESNQGVNVAGLFLQPSDTGFGPPVGITYQPSRDDGSAEAKPMAGSAKMRSGKGTAESAALEMGFKLATLDEGKWSSTVVVAELPGSSGSSDYDGDDSPAVFSPMDSSAASQSSFSSPDDSDDEEFDWGTKPTEIAAAAGDHIVRRLHPSVDKLRIGIPTAHIYGSTDPYYRQSLGLAGLCESKWASTYEHPDGHIVPRDKSVNVKIAATIERTLKMVDALSR
ncbi:serine hydrolase-domain-containing protein [Exophiala viscosa]|uniref:Serine hydrolase-domain-containing protein n=1 Tax=Exophiala viscosa TaxID=2486360 RepID=A0AAN6E507_9EURO|nr:serine hydrolase-domain-containing protein [Exophiala viscosa]